MLGNHEGHKGHEEKSQGKREYDDWWIGRVWGAAPRPGREKFSLHPRHVCDVPNRRRKGRTGDTGEAKDSGAPCGVTDEGVWTKSHQALISQSPNQRGGASRPVCGKLLGSVFGGMGNHRADGFVSGVDVEGFRGEEGLGGLREEVVQPLQA